MYTTLVVFVTKRDCILCFYYRSIALAANKAELPDMKMLALFGFGTVILRGAACTVNDLLDRDIDKKVTFLSFFLNFRSDVLIGFS